LILSGCIKFRCTKFPDLGDGYRLDYDPVGDISILDTKNTVIVEGHVLDYSFNEDFIIASERPRSIFPECNGSMPNATSDMCDEVFRKSKFYQIYIIVKKKRLVLGPFNKEQYLLKKKELGIPEDLRLLSIEK